MALPELDPEMVIEVGRRMEIGSKQTGERVFWPMTDEQERAVRETCANRWTIHAKPRQIGMSTVHCLLDALWVWNCDAHGHEVSCAIILDTEAKSTGRLDQCADFLAQMGELGVVFERRRASGQGPERIIFPGGSTIVAMGANGSRVGSSHSFHRYHFSEVPYWNRATELFGSLKPALSDDGVLVIETTMDICGDPLARNLWVEPNDFVKVFYDVQGHGRFRKPPESITDEQWEWAQGEGFSDRSAAAWWCWALDNEAAGDYAQLCHLFPQNPDHLFMSAAGRFIRCQPEVLKPVDVLTVDGEADSWKLEIYREPADTSGQCVIGVDTAAGKELDHSAVAVVDKADGQIVASFTSDLIWGDDLARVAAAAQRHYTRKVKAPFPMQRDETTTPLIIVEENGIGHETWHSVRRLGIPSAGVKMTDATRLEGLLLVKRAAERGELYGPRDFADEADSLHRDDLGRFKGRKDLSMAIGFCLRHMRAAPFIPAPQPRDREKFDGQGVLRRMRSRRGRTI